MADEKDIGKITSAVEGLKSNMAEANRLADVFANEAGKASGKAADQLKVLSSIYGSIAKSNAQALETQNALLEKEEERKKVLEEIKKLEKDPGAQAVQQKKLQGIQEEINAKRDSLYATERQLKAQKEYVKEATNSQGLISKAFDSGIVKMGAYLLSTERIISGLRNLGKSAQDVVDISIQSGSFLGMSGDFTKDMKDLTGATLAYGINLSKVGFEMGKLGISTEEGNAAFKKFSEITSMTKGPDAQAASMKTMTVVTGQLSRALGVSLTDATDYVVESQKKFGQTAGQSALILKSIRDTTESTNKEMAVTVVRGRDVTKVLFDIARESNSGAQSQDMMAKMITRNLVNLQANGANYQQALKSTEQYTKKITTEAPEWMRILSGRDLFSNLKNSMDSNGGNIGDTLKSQLEDAKPGLAKEVEDIMKGPGDAYTKQRYVQSLLQDTSVGMNSMEKQLNSVISKGGAHAAQVIQAVYNITDPMEQQRMIQQAKAGQKAEEMAIALKDAIDAGDDNRIQKLQEEAGITQKMSKEQIQFYKDEKGHYELKDMLSDKLLEKDKQAMLVQNQKHKTEVATEIKDLKARLAEAHDPLVRAALEKKIETKETQAGSLEKIEKGENKRNLASNILTGGLVKGAWNFMNSGVMQVATGAGSLLTMILLGRSQVGELKEIKALVSRITKGGTGSGGDGIAEAAEAVLGKKGKGLLRNLKPGRLKAALRAKGLKGAAGVGLLGLKELGAGGLKAGLSGLKGLTSGGWRGALNLAGKGAKGLKGIKGPGLLGMALNAGMLASDIAEGKDWKRSALKLATSGIGTTIGSALGSVVPVAGTLAGGVAGSYAGDKAGDWLADRFFGAEKAKPEDAIAGMPVANPELPSQAAAQQATQAAQAPWMSPQSPMNPLALTANSTSQSLKLNASLDLGPYIAELMYGKQCHVPS